MFRRVLTLLATVLFSVNAWALACASNAAGPWSTAGTWTTCGGGSPGIGDTVTITHAVTVSGNTTVGTSPAGGTQVVVVNSPGSLTVNSGVTFTVRGGIDLNAADMTLSSGSILEFDASNATTPLSQKYELRIGTAHSTSQKLVANGTSGSHVTIRSNAGGGNAWINDGTGPWLTGGIVQLTYADLLRMGDATNRAIRSSPSGAGNTTTILNCTFDTTGGIGGTYNINASATMRIEDSNFKSTAASTAIKFENGITLSGGTRTFLRNGVDKFVQFYTPGGFTIEDNYFGGVIETTTGDDWATFKHNFMRNDNTHNTTIIRGSTYRNYWFWDEVTQTNPHFSQAGLTSGTLDGDICEASQNTGAGQGDCILGDVPASAKTLTIQNWIILPNANGGHSGTLISLLGNANLTVSLLHNTIMAGEEAAIALGETYTGHPGMVTNIKSNAIWDTSARGYVAWDSGTNDAVTDLFASTAANFNSSFNVLAGSNLKGYNNFEFSSGSPGASDLTSTNPQFLDSARNLAKWDLSLGGPGTNANALAELAKRGTSGWNSNYSVQNLVAYVRAGFAPTNVALRNAGHDGVTIGAVEYQAAGSTKMALTGVGS